MVQDEKQKEIGEITITYHRSKESNGIDVTHILSQLLSYSKKKNIQNYQDTRHKSKLHDVHIGPTN